MEPIFHIILIMLLLWAAYTDVSARLIPNRIPLLAVLLFFPAAMGGAVTGLSGHLLVFGASFLVCLGLFAFNLMGGGDAKLIPAIALWAGPMHLPLFLVAMTISGGAIALFMLIRHRRKRASHGVAGTSMSDDSVADRPSVPYGLAIAFGGISFACQPVLNSFSSNLSG